MDCPICSFPVADARGLAAHFRHQAATHPNYAQWQEDLRFSVKAEGVDFVRCLECGHPSNHPEVEIDLQEDDILDSPISPN